MSRYVVEFDMPMREDQRFPVGNVDNIEIDDGGQSLMFQPDETRSGTVYGSDVDGCFFVRLQSWQDDARKRDPEFAQAHPLFRSYEGKRVRVTVEVVE